MRATMTRALAGTLLLCAFAAPVAAQDLRGTIADETTPLTAEESAALGEALLSDPATLTAVKPAKPPRLPSLSNPKALDISHTDKPDGSGSVAIKQPLASDTVWDAKVGADLGLGPQPSEGYRLGRPLPVTRDNGSGAAWASVGVSNIASIDARVDPRNDQGRLGTTLKHSIPLGSNYAVTLQNRFSVTETLSQQPSGPSDLPLMTLPAPGAANSPQIWGNEKIAKFDVLSTGTTLAAGLTSSSADPVTHNKLRAEQKLYGPLHVATAVSDLGQSS